MGVADRIKKYLSVWKDKESVAPSEEPVEEDNSLPDPYDESSRGNLRRRSVFTYNSVSDSWESEDDRWATEPIEEKDIVVVNWDDSEGEKEYAIWCEQHDRYERALLPLKKYEVMTTDGCHFSGRVCLAKKKRDDYGRMCYYNRSTIRWTISTASEPQCLVQICADCIQFQEYKGGYAARSLSRYIYSMNFTSKSLIYEMYENKNREAHYELDLNYFDENMKNLELPKVVIEQFFIILKHDYPSMPTVNIKEKEPHLILAYFLRPWDPAVAYLRFAMFSYAADRYFYQINSGEFFSADAKDNFYEIAEMLKLPPSRGLHRAYARYPLSLPVLKALQKIGFVNMKVMKSFFTGRELGLLYWYLKISYEKKTGEMMLYAPMVFLLQKILERYGEKKGARVLHSMLANLDKTGVPYGWGDGLQAFARFYNELPDWVRKKMMTDGPSPEACRCVFTAEMVLFIAESLPIYSPRELGMQARCGDYDIRLPRNVAECRVMSTMDWGRLKDRDRIMKIRCPRYVITEHGQNEILAAVQIASVAEDRYSFIHVESPDGDVPRAVIMVCKHWLEENDISMISCEAARELVLLPWETYKYDRLAALSPL